jgi:hypothetical protein
VPGLFCADLERWFEFAYLMPKEADVAAGISLAGARGHVG